MALGYSCSYILFRVASNDAHQVLIKNFEQGCKRTLVRWEDIFFFPFWSHYNSELLERLRSDPM